MKVSPEEAAFFTQTALNVPRHLPVLFTSLRQSDDAGRDIHSLLSNWIHDEHLPSPAIVVAHFARDVRETLLAVAVHSEAGTLVAGESFRRVCWLDGRNLPSVDKLAFLDPPWQRPSLILVDFSDVDPGEFILSSRKGQRGPDDYPAAIQDLCLMFHGRRERVIVGLPRFMLVNFAIHEMTRNTPACFLPAELFNSCQAFRLEYCRELLQGANPPIALHSLLCSNSCSLVHEIADFLYSRAGRVADPLATEDLLALAHRLQESGFFEIAYRLELYCRTKPRYQSLVALDGELTSADPAPHPVSTIRGLETVPHVLARARLTGLEGSGKTTVLAQIEHCWSLPPQFESSVEPPGVLDAPGDAAPLRLRGRKCPSWLPLQLSFTEASEGTTRIELLEDRFHKALSSFSLMPLDGSGSSQLHLLVAHRWLDRVCTLVQLSWIFSSRIMMLLDNFEAVPRQLRDQHNRDMRDLLISYAESGSKHQEPGIIMECRPDSDIAILGDYRIAIREMSEDLSEQFAAARLKNREHCFVTISRILKAVNKPVASLLRRPYLLEKLCSVAAADEDIDRLNLYTVMSRYVEQCEMKSSFEGKRALIEEYLPKAALSQKLAQAGRSLVLQPLPAEFAEEARAMKLLDATDPLQMAFEHHILRDYFAARALGDLVTAGSSSERFAEITDLLPKYSREWSTVFQVLIGYLYQHQADRVSGAMEILSMKDPNLAAICLRELPEEAARPKISHIAARLSLAEVSRAKPPVSSPAGVSELIADAEAVGFLDPRIAVNRPLGGTVEIARQNGTPAFRIGRYPVTNLEYSHFVADHGYEREKFWRPLRSVREELTKGDSASYLRYWRQSALNRPNYPVVGVSFYEALAYCRWLSFHQREDYEFCLPTEEQWSLASGVADIYLFKKLHKLRHELALLRDDLIEMEATNAAKSGKKNLHLRDQVWNLVGRLLRRRRTDFTKMEEREQQLVSEFDLLPFDTTLAFKEVRIALDPHRMQMSRREVTPVGLFQPTKHGCYDVFGNVWEWCDEWQPEVIPPSRPSKEKENLRLPVIVKGGPASENWDDVWHLSGGSFDPLTRFANVGFRVCCTPKGRNARIE